MLWVGVGAFCVALVVPLPTPVALGCFKKPAPEASCVGVKAFRVALVAPYLAPAASGLSIQQRPGRTVQGNFRFHVDPAGSPHTAE